MANSEKIDKIVPALIKFQSLVDPIEHDSKHELFNSTYASLEKILETIKKPLQECNLALVQMPIDSNRLCTVLMHSDSEQFISCEHELKPDDETTSGWAASVSLQRRIAITSLLCLNTKKPTTGIPPASENGPKAEGADDSRPWIEEGQFAALKKRIEAGEKGLVQKAKDTYQMKPEVLKQLMEAEQKSIKK